MADFRRCIYALALVALFAGFTASASAQQFQCSNTTSNPPLVRAEGYAELLGNITLDCTGGIPTPAGQPVPTVTIQVNLDVNVTSQVTAFSPNNSIEYLEALLIVDEPNSASNGRPFLNCGNTNAPDTTQAGPGVCGIVSTGNPQTTYDGTAGHPNVFQGRSLALITGQFNQVVFAGIPIDPPGTNCTTPVGGLCHRIIRITNLRGDATAKSVVVANVTQTINSTLVINPFNGLPVDNTTHPVATVTLGLAGTQLTHGTLPSTPGNIPGAKIDFVQCTSIAPSLTSPGQANVLTYQFTEGFSSAFKPLSTTQVYANGVAKPNYAYLPTGGLPSLGGSNTTTTTVLNNENVPGAEYDTESGFVNTFATTAGDNPLNPLAGGPNGNPGGAGLGAPFTNTGGAAALGIEKAGIATQGTRFMLNFSSIPNGTIISAQPVVNLVNVANTAQVTGVAILVQNTTASGFGGTPATPTVANTPIPIAGIPIVNGVPGTAYPGYAVYEVLFANPNALERLAVNLTISGTGVTPNLPSNLPQPSVKAQVQGSFAPVYDPLDLVRRAALSTGYNGTEILSPAFGQAAVATLPIPRFTRGQAPIDFYQINRCSCNLLFPYVTNAATAGGSFDTGIAIANTSVDPGNKSPGFFGFSGAAQNGAVQLWFYNKNASPSAEPNFLGQTNTQCTNVTTPGSCTGTLTDVPAGGMLTYTLFNGGAINGSTPAGSVLLPATGFTGYIIAQARFQYCHGFAFISKQGAGFQADNLAMGYLALNLDEKAASRTGSSSENEGN